MYEDAEYLVQGILFEALFDSFTGGYSLLLDYDVVHSAGLLNQYFPDEDRLVFGGHFIDLCFDYFEVTDELSVQRIGLREEFEYVFFYSSGSVVRTHCSCLAIQI